MTEVSKVQQKVIDGKYLKEKEIQCFEIGVQTLSKLKRVLTKFIHEHKIFRGRFIFKELEQFEKVQEDLEQLQTFITT